MTAVAARRCGARSDVLALLRGAAAPPAGRFRCSGCSGIHAQVVSWHRRGDQVPDAVLVTSVDSLRRARHCAAGAHGGVGQAPRARRPRPWRPGCTLLLTARPELVARGAVLVPPIGIEVDRWPAVAPLVRRRRREQLGLPEVHVVKVEGGVEPDRGRARAGGGVGCGGERAGHAPGARAGHAGRHQRRHRSAPRASVPGATSRWPAGPDTALALAHEIAERRRPAAASLSRRGSPLRRAPPRPRPPRPAVAAAPRPGAHAARSGGPHRGPARRAGDPGRLAGAGPCRRRAGGAHGRWCEDRRA